MSTCYLWKSHGSKDVYENVNEPWTWPGSAVIPGGLLMSECAVAAQHTVSEDFVLDSLQSHFLGGPSSTKPMQFKVTRLSNGRRFAVRGVVIEQDGKSLLTATVQFVSSSPWNGPAMVHSVSRQTNHSISKITLDDLEVGRHKLGPFMKFQRLPPIYRSVGSSPSPVSGITASVAQIIPSITDAAGSNIHTLGIINLSDYHVMDAPMQLSNITFGMPAVNDYSRTPTHQMNKIGTTLNHTIHFHTHDRFRADDLTYIEAETSWAKDGRAMISTKIFSRDGMLIATCVQEVRNCKT